MVIWWWFQTLERGGKPNDTNLPLGMAIYSLFLVSGVWQGGPFQLGWSTIIQQTGLMGCWWITGEAHFVGNISKIEEPQSSSGWWFGTFFIFPYIGKNHPNWLIFFRGVETTNQSLSDICRYNIHIRIPGDIVLKNRRFDNFPDKAKRYLFWVFPHEAD
jgi:hypothetical protein